MGVKLKLIFFLLFIFFGCNLISRSYKIRPVKLKVIDFHTKKPLKGILVYYFLIASKPKKILLCFPHPESHTKKNIIIKKKFYTDSNGLVEIDFNEIEFKESFRWLEDKIIINLDIVDKLPSNYFDKGDKLSNFIYRFRFYIIEKELFYNPKSIYRGFHIFNFSYSINPKDWGNPDNDDFTVWDKFDALYNGESFIKDREEFIIELKRYSKK